MVKLKLQAVRGRQELRAPISWENPASKAALKSQARLGDCGNVNNIKCEPVASATNILY